MSACLPFHRLCRLACAALRCLQKENPFAEELIATAQYISRSGHGILASDESNATTGGWLRGWAGGWVGALRVPSQQGALTAGLPVATRGPCGCIPS